MVPNLLLLAVSFDRGRVLLAIPPPVIGVAGTPLLRTVPADLAVVQVGRDFLPVIIGAAAALAFGLAAYQLPRLIFRWLEGSFTVAAMPFDHTDGCRIWATQLSRWEI